MPQSQFSRTAPIKVDPGSGELGRKNVDDHTLRKILKTVEFANCTATGTMRGVFYGSYNKQPAALIVFRFVFHSPLQRKWRYTYAKITTTFATKIKDPKYDIDHEGPYTLTMFPYTLFGDVSEEERSWNMEVAASLKASSGIIADGGVEAKSGREGSFTRGNRMQIQGFLVPSSSGHQKENVARWDLAENVIQKTGIPHDFCCGIIVACPGDRFEAAVNFEFSLGLAGSWKFNAWPWDVDDPLIFEKNDLLKDLDQVYLEEMRDMLKDRDFKDLTEEDFQKLAPLPKEYHVSPFYPIIADFRVPGSSRREWYALKGTSNPHSRLYLTN